MSTATWMIKARSYLGVREYPGAQSNPLILRFWQLARLAGIKDDRVPWCSGFVCAVLEESAIRSTRSDGARSWLTWGQPLVTPIEGCIVVFKRAGGYHVGFVVGMDRQGGLLVLGGNQDDAVTIAAFPAARKPECFRWPLGWPLHESLPVLAGAPNSTSEA